MYSLKFTILLGMLLAIPFLLRLKGTEPYPALLLPEGASNFVYTNKETGLSYTLMYGRTASGEWKAIEPISFISPIPVQYLPPVIAKLTLPDTINAISTRDKVLQRLHLADRYKITPNDRNELYKWFQHHLTKQHFDSAFVKLVTYTETISSDKTNKRSKKIDNEQIINISE